MSCEKFRMDFIPRPSRKNAADKALRKALMEGWESGSLEIKCTEKVPSSMCPSPFFHMDFKLAARRRFGFGCWLLPDVWRSFSASTWSFAARVGSLGSHGTVSEH